MFVPYVKLTLIKLAGMMGKVLEYPFDTVKV